uniref:Uncharacterized protein n=1 Tax=Rhizophora mucronata TaxID=61149 RepID=A0A2P2QRX5_RHIMU
MWVQNMKIFKIILLIRKLLRHRVFDINQNDLIGVILN